MPRLAQTLVLGLASLSGLLPLRADPPGDRLTMSDAVALAWIDAARLDPATAAYVRYFYDPEEDLEAREDNYSILSLQLNLLSRGPNIERPIRVARGLYRANLLAYQIDPVVFASTRVVDTYFHTPVRGADGAVTHAVPAYLPQAELKALGEKLQSPAVAVIYRADWWVHKTGVQEGRDGFGYYDYLKLKTGTDVDELAGQDQKKAEREFAELAAVIRESGIAVGARQVFRFGTRRGCYWETRDPDAEKLAGNANPDANAEAQTRLFDDYKFAGKEIIFTLPNRLPGFALENAKDELVKSGPPNLVGDKRPQFNGQDARVHVGAGCVTCHNGGALKPLNDYMRRAYRQGRGVAIGSPDYALTQRIQRVYFGPLQETYDADSAAFAQAYLRASGIPAASVPRTYVRVWERYRAPLTAARAAVELDTTRECLRTALAWRASTSGLGVNLPLESWLGPEDDEIPVNRSIFELAYPLLRALVTDWERAGRPAPKTLKQ